MKIEFDTKEKAIVESLPLPAGTTLLQYENKDSGYPEYLYWYKIDETGNMVMTRDLVENNRQETPEDEEIFKDFTKEDTLNWWALTYEPNNTPYWQYRCVDKLWYEHFKYLRHGGYIPATNQGAFEIQCYKKRPLAEQLEEVQMVVPLIKEANTIKYSTEDRMEAPSKYLGIFEKSLSEYGIYELHIFEDVLELTITVYGNTSLVEKFTNLEDAIKYICKHHYYQKD